MRPTKNKQGVSKGELNIVFYAEIVTDITIRNSERKNT